MRYVILGILLVVAGCGDPVYDGVPLDDMKDMACVEMNYMLTQCVGHRAAYVCARRSRRGRRYLCVPIGCNVRVQVETVPAGPVL